MDIFEGKAIRVKINEKDVFYTINRVIERTPEHLMFIDKFGREKIIRLIDIIEGSEV